MDSHTIALKALRRELRVSMEDRNKLSQLHSVVTERINAAYGEEKELLRNFRQEVKDALSCSAPSNWVAR